MVSLQKWPGKRGGERHLAAMRENGLHIKGDRGENQPSLYDRLSKLTAGERRVDGAVKLL